MKEPARQVTAALLVDHGRVLIARRQSGRWAGYWEFPGGKVEDGETPEECLGRELKEELGIVVQVGAFCGGSVYHYEEGTIELLGYWAAWAGGEITPRVHAEIRWVYPGQLGEFTFSPADRPFVENLKAVPGGSPGPPKR